MDKKISEEAWTGRGVGLIKARRGTSPGWGQEMGEDCLAQRIDKLAR